MKSARRRRRMQGLAQFLSCFKFIHQSGRWGTVGGIGLVVSFIFHVGGWNDINISLSLTLYKSGSHYQTSQTFRQCSSPGRLLPHCYLSSCVWGCVGPTWTETEVLIKHLGSNLPRTGPVISLCLEQHSDTGVGTSGRSHSPPQTPGSHIEAVPITISSCSRGMMSLLYSIPINFTAMSEEASTALRRSCETVDGWKVENLSANCDK